MELLEEFPPSNDLLIVKGKRTKRPRPSSSASSNGGVSEFGGGGSEICNSMLVSSPATTSSGISTTTEEDEDMANCLILLACGGSPPQLGAEDKSSSRKFAEMAATTVGKVGINVYECKTCNRAFPSFQALGGHRASHKRPKLAADDIDRKKSPPATPRHDQEKEEVPSLKTKITILSRNRSLLAENSKSKIHECSICGSEFASGQALGGHMRRHRSAPAVTNSTKSGTHIENDTASRDVSEKARNVFELDLNLPAPPEDDQRPENFHQFSSNQQRRLAFSVAAPLVGCHY